MNLFRWVIGCFILLPFYSLKGQHTILNHYSTQDGLPANSITTIVSDAYNQLWIGTSNGVARFDGTAFTNFYNEGRGGASLHANSVYSMISTVDTSLWISTFGGGISMYNFKQNQFKTQLKGPSENTILENRVSGMHVLDTARVLIRYRGLDGNTGGLTILDTKGNIKSHHLQEIIQADGYKYRLQDMIVREDIIYGLGFHLYKIDPKTFSYTTVDFPFEVNRYSEVEAIAEVGKDRLLIGGVKGLFLYHINQDRWEELHPTLSVKKIIHQDNMHLILTSNELIQFDAKTKKLETLIKNSDFDKWGVNPSFNCLQLHGGYLWLGTNVGLWSIQIKPPIVESTRIKVKDEKVRAVRLLFASKERTKYYIDYNGKILKREQSDFSFVQKVPGRIHDHVSFSNDSLKWLLASDQGIFMYDIETNRATDFIQQYQLDVLMDKGIWSLYWDKNLKKLWIGTRQDGLYLFDMNQQSVKNYRHEKDNPFSLCFDRFLFKMTKDKNGNLWISTDRGISVINLQTEEWKRPTGIVDTLSEYIVHHSAMGDKYMWIGSRDQGLYRYDIENSQTKIYSRKDGLPFTGVNRVIYKDGLVYCSTREGVVIINEETGALSVFDRNQGIDHKNLYYAQLDIDKNGDFLIYAGNENIIYRIPKKDFFSQQEVPPVELESVSIIGVESDTTFYYPTSPLVLEANQNNFLISYASVDFDHRPIEYRYKMEGYDRDWVYAGSRKTVNYANLNGGKYTFRVESSLKGRAWKKSKSLIVQIDQIWYKTNWFKLLVFLLISGVVGLIYRVRMQKNKLTKEYQRLLSEVEMKALRSQMNPHFIFNALNSIKSFIVENDRYNATDYLNKFSKLIRIILNHSKSDVVSIAKEIEALRLYIQMEKLRFEAFEFDMNVDASIDQERMLIPPMIIQPYLENAIWHGLQHKTEGNRVLSVHFEKAEDHRIHLCIRDNGIGRAKAQELKSKTVIEKKSYGMEITQERINLASGKNATDTITITDLFEGDRPTGTEVRLLLPFTLQKERT
ncbi:MAG: histidine kinase [Saprospiraceae bacterium]|nr:histidine kinase [Saprospiraceae bacterium]